MKIFLRAASAALALITTVTVAGCASADGADKDEDKDIGVIAPMPDAPLPDLGDPDIPNPDIPDTEIPEAPPADVEPEAPEEPEPTVSTVSYILMNSSGVNMPFGGGHGLLGPRHGGKIDYVRNERLFGQLVPDGLQKRLRIYLFGLLRRCRNGT